MTKEKGNEKTKQPASWNDVKEKQMLNAFSTATIKHGGDGKSLKAAAWKEVTAAYNKESGDNLSNEQLQSKLGDLKGKYGTLASLVELSGAEFDESSGVITMNDENWNDAITKNPKAKWFKTKKFPLYMLCNQLFKASTATGEFAGQIKAPDRRVMVDAADAIIENDNADAIIDDDDDDAKIDDHPDGTKTKLPPLKRKRFDENTAALLKNLKEIVETELPVDKDPNEVSYLKAVSDFKRLKSLESTPAITPTQSVTIKETLA